MLNTRGTTQIRIASRTPHLYDNARTRLQLGPVVVVDCKFSRMSVHLCALECLQPLAFLSVCDTLKLLVPIIESDYMFI